MLIGRTSDDSGGAAPAADPAPASASDTPFTEDDFIDPDADAGDDDDAGSSDDAEGNDEGDPEKDDADAATDSDEDEDTDDEDGDEDDGEAEAADPTLKTIKFGDKEYEVPAELEEGFMLKSDHTRKTTALAEARKEIEAQTEHQKNIGALRDGQFQDAAALLTMDQALAQYAQIDWDQLSLDDPIEAQRLHIKHMTLKDDRVVANQRLHQKASETDRLQQARLAAQATATRTALATEIDGWSEDLEESMAQYAIRQGANEQVLRTTVDKPILKILHDAYQFDLIRKARLEKLKGKGKPKPKPAKPAARLKGKKAAGRRDPDKMGIEDWVAKRNAEVARKEGRG